MHVDDYSVYKVSCFHVGGKDFFADIELKYKIGKRGRSSNDIYVKSKPKNVKADELCGCGCGRRLLFGACYVIMKKMTGKDRVLAEKNRKCLKGER